MNTTFFDSHGAAWQTCAAAHPEAVAFGPTGVARPLELGSVEFPGDGTPWARALHAGRVSAAQESHEWDVLTM